MLHENLGIDENGCLTFAGCSTTKLAAKYGTPLMLMDEGGIRGVIRRYVQAFEKYFGASSFPLYASKALSCKGIYRIASQEGIGVDIVSSGELLTASEAGFPLSKCFFHGNCKTDFDISFGIDKGVGYFVVDGVNELEAIDAYARSKGIIQNILLRLTPGIDTHTHEAVKTGKVDSKFGTAIETGQADTIVAKALSLKNIELVGFHCHIGSQIFETKPFTDAADIMIAYIGKVKQSFGKEIKLLNLGGGFGVRYTEKDPVISYENNIKEISEHIKAYCMANNITMPAIIMEPGRSIVAANGITLYTVGSVKEITGYKNYVAVDGGMPDNPRYALYKSDYTVCIANKIKEQANYPCTVAGRCCESGDLLQENCLLPKPERGDILAVLVTGAYNYSMASNYNRLPRPPIVLINEQKDTLMVRRETNEDLIRLDV